MEGFNSPEHGVIVGEKAGLRYEAITIDPAVIASSEEPNLVIIRSLRSFVPTFPEVEAGKIETGVIRFPDSLPGLESLTG